MRAFESIQFTALAPGPRLIVLGAVHGNETCGTEAIRRVVEAMAAGRLQLSSGAVTFVPVTNPKAYEARRREGDRNLNRGLSPTETPVEFEDHVANWLCPLLAAHEVLLDLHSFRSPGKPFALVGPSDNAGPLEPFAHAQKESALAVRLGVERIVDGWLATYAEGVARRRARHAGTGSASFNSNADYGVGTTEYMRRRGGWALTLECGQHDDPEAPEVGHRAILRTLAHLGLIEAPAPLPMPAIEGLQLFEVVDKASAGDTFARAWTSFDTVRAGELIGRRADGQEVRAAADCRIVFPSANAESGQEWFYLARVSGRFGGAPTQAK